MGALKMDGAETECLEQPDGPGVEGHPVG